METKIASKLQYLCIFLLILLVNPFLLFAELKDLVGTPKGEEAKGIANLKRYLWKLGYVVSNDNRRPESNSEKDDLFDEELEEALKKYQAFFGLQVTGVLDEETVKKLSLPRCGFPDIIHRINTSSSSSSQLNNISASLYAFYPDGLRWPTTSLSYSYEEGKHTDIIRAIGDAFDIWASTTGIFTFTHTNESGKYEPDITISFKRGDHGDGAPFDGRGGIVGHSGLPPLGEIHLDDDEDWINGAETDKVDLMSVMLHELGHALGLAHSNNPNASMYPSIGTGERRLLIEDDVDGMKALYSNN